MTVNLMFETIKIISLADKGYQVNINFYTYPSHETSKLDDSKPNVGNNKYDFLNRQKVPSQSK